MYQVFEYYLIDFCQQILTLAGIDDEPTFRWNRVVNQAEQTNTILMAAQYLTDEIIIKKLPFLTPEEADKIISQRDEEDFDQFNQEDMEEEDMDEGIDEEEANMQNEVLAMLDGLLKEFD